MTKRAIMSLCGALGVVAGSAYADTIDLPIAADTFINSAAPNANAGATAWIDAGTDGGNLGSPGVRRALLKFDLSGIPPGSTITSAVLRLVVIKVPGFGQSEDSSFSLYRMNVDWVEGTKSGANGALASAGESTWNARLHGSANWTTVGAASDASAVASATVAIGSTEGVAYSWGGEGVLNDVQFWLDNPSKNSGWLLRSLSEATARTVRGFGSREAVSNRGSLTVGYTPAGGGSNQPPLVFISTPTNGATFTTPLSLDIVAEVADPDGTVTNVQFLSGSEVLGQASVAPYSINAVLYPGSYQLTAVATDNQGASTTSSNVAITVSSVAITNPIAARIPKGNITVELRTAADGMASPIGMAVPKDDSGRMFVYDQNGLVHVVTAAGRLATPLLDLRSRLVLLGAYDERGLLGLAIHPGFNTNQLLYTYTSEPVDGAADFQTGLATNNHQSVITEWKVSAANSNVVDVASRREVMRLDEPQSNHNGGAMHFGPDGFLYVTLGDGGQANDVAPGHVPGGNAQSIDQIYGKVIRIDVNGRDSANGKYGIPTGNPFVGTNGLDEIFAYGLRNPFSFSFDRQTGVLYLADVGQNRVEEINIITNGGNYGWNLREARFWFDPAAGAVVTAPVRPAPANLIDPIAQYDHDDGLAVIGGYVYRGTAIPELVGRYVFGDWGAFNAPSGRLFYLDETNGVNELQIGLDDRQLRQWIKGFGEGPDGELYVFTTRWLGPSGNTGRMLKLVPAGEPLAMEAPQSAGGTNLVLSWSGGDGPFAVQKKNRVADRFWQDDVYSQQRAATVSATSQSGFFRVHEAGHLPPIPFTVSLTSASERPPNNSTASGQGILVLDGNTLTFNISYGGLTGPAVNGHIHGPVDTTTNAPVVLDLAPFNGGSWGASGTLSGVVVLTDLQKSYLLDGRTYVNLHTASFPGGEIRGQIAPVNFQVALDAASAGPAVKSAGLGLGNLMLVGNQLTMNVTYDGLTGVPTMAHIHGPATPGQNAGILVDLAPFNGGSFGTAGMFSGTAVLTPTQLAALIDGLTYINIHTPGYGAGEIRGQIVAQATAVPFTALLSGLAERPTPLTNSATGTGSFSLEGHLLTFNIQYSGLSAAASGAHIHGPANTTASSGVLIDLAPFNGGAFGTSGTISGTVLLNTAQRNAVLSGLTYVNFHTANNPSGELRGQIALVAMTAALSGNNERTTPVSTPGAGSGTFALIRNQLAVAVTYQGLLSSATASHIHGPAGFTANGSVLVDLAPFNGGGFDASGQLSGIAELPYAALLNVIDGQTYVNFHTTNNPSGEIRGHLVR
jgi:glucose/arabinose dehydrogenase